MDMFSGQAGQPDRSNTVSNDEALDSDIFLNGSLNESAATGSQRNAAFNQGALSSPNTLNTATRNASEPVRGKHRNANRWSVEDIEWNHIDREKVRNDLTPYYVVTAASFVETAADLYTANLVEHFPDARAQQWLVNYWQPEELQHGLALRTYVQTVWPELDWQSGYNGFLAEYSQLCTMDELESSRALEMVARCVVETGTSTFYTMLHNTSDEPVLKHLAGLIRQDEVSHYNHFRHFFETYQREERMGRMGVVRSLYKRFTEAENEDAYIGLKHAWLMRHPGEPFQDQQIDALNRRLRAMLRGNYPYRMALKMLLQPLALNRTLIRLSLPMLEGAARRLMFRT